MEMREGRITWYVPDAIMTADNEDYLQCVI